MPKRARSNHAVHFDSPDGSEREDADRASSPMHIGRACERCRVRKIRCDRTTPCGNCRTAGISCISARPTQPRPQGQRVLISKEYEVKIDAIETRLDAIERMMATTNELLQKLTKPDDLTLSKPAITTTTPSTILSASFLNEAIVGDASLLAHSRHARRVLETKLRSSPLMSSDPAIVNSLTILHSTMQGHALTHDKKPGIQLGAETYKQLPSYDLFASILQNARKTDALFFSVWTPFLSLEELLNMCTSMYDRPQGCATYRKVLVYGAMLYLFVEHAENVGATTAVQSSIATLSHNLNLALKQSQAYITPTYESVLAAMLGTSHAILTQDYAMAWTFNNISSRMCQDLGWHRSPERITERTDAQRILFWIMYYIDKCLSLRLGRSSTIQDFDISIDLPIETSEASQGWIQWLRVMVDLGRQHAQIYEKLYSPGSFTQDPDVRRQSIHGIAQKLHTISTYNFQLPGSTLYRQDYMSYLSKSNEVIIGCLLTLTHRAMPINLETESFSISEQCLQAARSTIRSHLEMVQMNKKTYDYVTWTLVNCPFTPFIVLFCNVITDLNTLDLDLLEAFLRSLDNLDARSAPSAKHLRELCQAFFTLASHYVEATQRQGQYQNAVTKMDFDPTIPILPSALFDNWLAGSQDFLWDWSGNMTV